MSGILNLDPSKGFLALPPSVFDLEMSPGAFRVLSYLCNLASKDGWCWPSLEQIGSKMGRGKAAVSGYINELRELGLVETRTQRMASGYNYRLKFLVTFWSVWINGVTNKPAENKHGTEVPAPIQKIERSVQSSERPTTSKHKIHKTHTTEPSELNRSVPQTAAPAAAEVVVKKIYEEWVECTRGVPFGQFSRPVPADLIHRSEEVLLLHQIKQDGAASSAAILDRLSATWQDLGVDCPPETLTAQVQTLLARKCSAQCLDNLAARIRDIWRHFWKYPPLPRQFDELLAASSEANQQQSQLRVIKSHLKSWRLGNQQLDPSITCDIIG